MTRVVLAALLPALAVACPPPAAADAPRGRDVTRGPGPAQVALSPDGKTLATGSGREVKLWDPATGKLLRTLAGHGRPVRAVAFAPDGRALATAAGEDRDGKLTGEVRVWDPATGDRRRTLAVEASDVNALAFSPDGRRLVGAGSRGLWVWDAAGGDLRQRTPGPAAVLAVAFAPDGKALAGGVFDQWVHLWDARTWAERRVLKGHRSEVRAVAFSPDGKTLATGGVGEIILWNPGTGGRVRSLDAGATVWALAFGPAGKALYAGVGDPRADAAGGVQVWDPAGGRRLRTWPVRGGAVRSVAPAADGKALATGRYDGTVTVWEVGGARPR